MARSSTWASAEDTRSTVSSTPRGKPGSRAAVRPGSSRNTSGVAPGAASRVAWSTSRVRVATALAATGKARSAGTPTACRARPSVTGPVSWTLNGATRPAMAARNALRLTNGSWSRPPPSGRSGSTAASSTSREPSGSTSTPAMPHAAWGIMPSTAARRGSVGAAGSRGWRSRTNAMASSTSRWGRLPTADASPIGRSTSLMVPPPAAPRSWSPDSPHSAVAPSEIATRGPHRQISCP